MNLSKLGIYYKFYTCKIAVIFGNMEVLRYAHENDYPWQHENMKLSHGLVFEREYYHSYYFYSYYYLYSATREISLHDCEIVKTELPEFAVLLTPDQVDAKFDARRKRKDECNDIHNITNIIISIMLTITHLCTPL